MSASTKILKAAAGAAGGDPLTVDQVFSTTVYSGNGGANTITTGIDLSGSNDGLVWLKGRSNQSDHGLYDTKRGVGNRLQSHSTSAQDFYNDSDTASYFRSFLDDGFNIGYTASQNASGQTYTSWTFKAAPKFFDCVSVNVADPEPATVTASHNLGQQVGMIIMKSYLHTYPWHVWHRSLSANKFLELNTTAAQAQFGGTGFSSTSTTVTIPGSFIHSGSNNGKAIIYLFADNSAAPSADRLISCGSYTGNGNSTGPVINVGFQPQFIFYKCATASENWEIIDNVRGTITNGDDKILRPNLNGAEILSQRVNFLSNGWQPKESGGHINASGRTYIYMAIKAED